MNLRKQFAKILFLGRAVSDDERELLSVPARFGGLGIFNPCTLAPIAHNFSRDLCSPLMKLILRQADEFDPNTLREEQDNIKAKQDLDRDQAWTTKMADLTKRFPKETQKAIQQAMQKGVELGDREAP